METVVNTVNVSLDAWREEQKAWNDRSDFFVELHERDDRKAQVVYFLNYLEKKGLLPKEGAATLDIGCGVGDYALGLAKKGYEAHGIDLSDGMIKGGQELAKREGTALKLFVGPWSEETRQSLEWNRKFDLTYSFFCPVMFDKANVAAMSQTSKDKCLLVVFADRHDTIVEALTQHFYGTQDTFDWQSQVDGCISVAHQVGKDVNVDYITTPEEEAFDMEAAIEYFMLRLYSEEWGTKDAMKAAMKDALQPYVKEDGKVHNITEDKVAWISWTVK